MKRFLGLDIGKRRIGVAISDISNILAVPLKTLTVDKYEGFDDEELIESIIDIINEFSITDLVVGLPLSLQGEVGENAEEIKEFAKRIIEDVTERKINLRFVDERFSTVIAHNQLHQVGKQPSRERKIVDQVAAVIILQSVL